MREQVYPYQVSARPEAEFINVDLLSGDKCVRQPPPYGGYRGYPLSDILSSLWAVINPSPVLDDFKFPVISRFNDKLPTSWTDDDTRSSSDNKPKICNATATISTNGVQKKQGVTSTELWLYLEWQQNGT